MLALVLLAALVGVPAMSRAVCVTRRCGDAFTVDVERLRHRIQRDCECAVRADTPRRYRGCVKRILREAAQVKALPRACLAAVRGCEFTSICGTTSKAVVCCVRKPNGALVSSIATSATRCPGLACQRPRHAAEVCTPAARMPIGPFRETAFTVRDKRTGLEWERKDASRPPALHAADGLYTWAGRCTGPALDPFDNAPCQPTPAAAAACRAQTPESLWTAGCEVCGASDGRCVMPGLPHTTERAITTIWAWLAELNAENFAGHASWRLPAVAQEGAAAELETIVDAAARNCTEALDSPGTSPFFGPEPSPPYWAATTHGGSPSDGFQVDARGVAQAASKLSSARVRAVRGP